ncbi:MAG: transposase [Nostoc sp.]
MLSFWNWIDISSVKNFSGITIFELPCYSPELNLIEILWWFLKYKWIDKMLTLVGKLLSHLLKKLCN